MISAVASASTERVATHSQRVAGAVSGDGALQIAAGVVSLIAIGAAAAVRSRIVLHWANGAIRRRPLVPASA